MTYISDKQIAERWGVHRVTPWKLSKTVAGFPKPIKLSPGVTRWKLAEIEEWEAAKAAAA